MILAVVEYSNGKVSKSTLEMTTAARGIGREGPITLLVLGSGVASVWIDSGVGPRLLRIVERESGSDECRGAKQDNLAASSRE